MEIIVGKNSGFCFGVSNAVAKTKEELNIYNEAYCLGELVHNKQVISKLESKGLHTIDDITKGKSRVIIRAHGISKDIYNLAKTQNIELVDLTCPKVLQTHEMVKEYSDKGYYIIFVGISNHPEAIGTMSFSNNISLIEKIEEVNYIVEKIKSSKFTNIFVLAQTTFSVEKFEHITTKLKEQLEKDYNVIIKNTICHTTQSRQQETEDIAKKVEYMIIIGGKNSSNTKKLYDISQKYCPTILIENEKELNIEEIKKYNKIGIMAGASTPQESIDAVVMKLKNN